MYLFACCLPLLLMYAGSKLREGRDSVLFTAVFLASSGILLHMFIPSLIHSMHIHALRSYCARL